MHSIGVEARIHCCQLHGVLSAADMAAHGPSADDMSYYLREGLLSCHHFCNNTRSCEICFICNYLYTTCSPACRLLELQKTCSGCFRTIATVASYIFTSSWQPLRAYSATRGGCLLGSTCVVGRLCHTFFIHKYVDEPYYAAAELPSCLGAANRCLSISSPASQIAK